MTSPLLPFQGDFDPRAFAFQDLAAERKDKCLNIGKCDGARSGLPKEGLQGLLMTFLHKYMMAECASISHVCRCGAAVASASYPFPPPDRLPPSYAGVGAAGDGGMLFSGLWWLVDDRLATECGQSDDAFLEARPLVGSAAIGWKRAMLSPRSLRSQCANGSPRVLPLDPSHRRPLFPTVTFGGRWPKARRHGQEVGMDEQSEVKRRKGGRQALPDDLRRSIRREVWLSPLELADLKARASTLGITPGEYMRRAITESPMPKPPVPQVNLVAWRELARLAANTNQYQHAVNNGSAHAWQPELIPDLLNAIREVRMALLGVASDSDGEGAR